MALLRSLPKAIRRQFVPVADNARAFLRDHGPADGALATVLAAWLSLASGSAVSAREWNVEALPNHLRMTFVVEGRSGEAIGASKQLDDLKAVLARRARREVATVLAGHESRGLGEFPTAGVPSEVRAEWNGQTVTGYPALSDNGSGDSVDLIVFSNPHSAQLAMWSGTRRLLLMQAPGVTRALRSLTNRTKLAISNSSYPSVADLLADVTRATADQLMTELGAPVWARADFDEMAGQFRSSLPARVLRAVADVGEVLAGAARVRARLDGVRAPALLRSVEDMRAQLDLLVGPGFVGDAGLGRLADVERYLSAMEVRLEKAAANPGRDLAWMDRVHRVEDEWTLTIEARPALARTELSKRIRWMLEDLRVSVFAQTLGGAKGVSEERIRRAIAELSAA
jgi:ATP-dependent helicase HrpA